MILGAKVQLRDIRKLLPVLLLTWAIFSVPVRADSVTVEPGMVIHQVQTGAVGSASQEYISLYNNDESAIDITGWCVVYASASDFTKTELVCFLPQENTRLLLNGHSSLVLATNEFLQTHADVAADFIFAVGLSGSSGHIKLLDAEKSIVDVVGWGAAAFPEGAAVAAHPTGKILQRLNPTENLLQDSDNNLLDFTHAPLTISASGNLEEEFVPAHFEDVPLIISEVLPNAEGTDAGKEFIEFYNPISKAVNLKGYKLETGSGYSKSYDLPDITVPALGYLALNDSQTGLILSNTSTSLRLKAPSGAVVSTMVTYDSPDEEVAWAYMNGVWQETLLPTPGAGNRLETGAEGAASLSPLLTPCKPDQVRNSETGRCRKVAAAATPLVCKPDQVRNPETGRCRKIQIPDTTKPCPAGQERHPETKRCRKVVPKEVSNPPKVKDVKTTLVSNNIKWWAAGFAATGSLGYAGYEWRRELFSVANAIKGKIMPS